MTRRAHELAVAGLLLIFLGTSSAQSESNANASTQPNLTADYPRDRPGVFVQTMDWIPMAGVTPVKTKAKHGIAASLSYGAVPATVVAEYAGLHAQVQIEPGQPMFCLCHLLSLPGDPVIVKLHAKKESRELDGGRMTVYPVVGGSKMADAKKSDLVPVDMSQPENMVWLVRPKEALAPGEYALMLGTQNMNVFAFTVAAEVPANGKAK